MNSSFKSLLLYKILHENVDALDRIELKRGRGHGNEMTLNLLNLSPSFYIGRRLSKQAFKSRKLVTFINASSILM